MVVYMSKEMIDDLDAGGRLMAAIRYEMAERLRIQIDQRILGAIAPSPPLGVFEAADEATESGGDEC